MTELLPEEYRRVWEAEDFRDVTVRITFSSPVLVNSPFIYFDGILSHLCLKLALGQDYYTLSSKSPFADADRVIRERAPHPVEVRDGVMQCSVIEFYDEHGWVDVTTRAKLVHIYKRFDPTRAHLISTGRSKISISSGIFRNYVKRYPSIMPDYALVHTRAKVRAMELLLEHLNNIGKKYVLGYGKVRSIEILDPLKRGIVHDGIALRPIPEWLCSHAEDVVIMPYRVPYWDRKNMVRCAVPGSRCELRG